MTYAVVSTLVNLVNAYDKQEIIPEMIELAKFAKRHIPEEHELDDPDFVQKRVEVMIFDNPIRCHFCFIRFRFSFSILNYSYDYIFFTFRFWEKRE